MRIETPQPDAAYYLGHRDDLAALLGRPSDRELRPCPGCELPCNCCQSTTCSRDCSSACPYAPRAMSSDPEAHPIESRIVPLVYAPYCLRLVWPCWSCEGHCDNAGTLHKLPRVWFYARSLAYPSLIAARLSDPHAARRLSTIWQVCVVDCGDNPNGLFSIEPRPVARDAAALRRLHADVQAIADALPAQLKGLARHRLGEVDAALQRLPNPAARASARR